jgi:quercetin dioxygenase-like cupin family protein
LETTTQALFGGEAPAAGRPRVVRADDATQIEVDPEGGPATCHLLLAGDAPMRLLEFDGLPRTFLDYFEHDGFEVTYVISGRVEIDIAGEVTRLRAGDSISYRAALPHRLRSVGPGRARVLMIETDTVHEGRGTHVPVRSRTRARRGTAGRTTRPIGKGAHGS